MKHGEVVVIYVYYNFTKFHQNRMKNKKRFINSPFFCSEFQSVSRMVKIVHSVPDQLLMIIFTLFLIGVSIVENVLWIQENLECMLIPILGKDHLFVTIVAKDLLIAVIAMPMLNNHIWAKKEFITEILNPNQKLQGWDPPHQMGPICCPFPLLP